jgi:limonene-1,2-epoxide hydrolase
MGGADLHTNSITGVTLRLGMPVDIEALYRAFNARDVDSAVAAMAPGVRWPNGWEGGYVNGRDEVREYWRRQWAEIDSSVEPVAIDEEPGGLVAVRVHQVVRDLKGEVLVDKEVTHVYRVEDGLIAEMRIED